ncbi:Swt1 family HEPN domain-containing protein [Bacillus infantis]|uniref:Swt1 family HEPN domain-containing protein n=1 Tax=Bacillus infantis TaxID=324767 RepID=UPI0020A0697F|nr:Swt1 family HEPN domain-containing protein [Bacillus infantis]MCP1156613.1 Swt1 family HEPN domain-containing protein [Bacillus infantis]
MSFTYQLPDEGKFYKALLKHLQIKNHNNTVIYLKGGRISFEDSGVYSPNFQDGGRWNAYGLYIKFHVNPSYLDLLDNEENNSLILNICDSLMDSNRGYDIKRVEFITDIDGEYDLENDLIEDLNNKSDFLSEEIIKELLPEDLKEKGFYMAEVYTYLYCIENSLRLFIEKVCKNVYGENYFQDIQLNKQAKEKIENRKESKQNKKWISLRGDSDLFYLDFVELATIIENNWSIFKKFFPNEKGQQWIISKISDLANIRNLIAHNSYVEKNEKDLLKSYYNVILKQLDLFE